MKKASLFLAVILCLALLAGCAAPEPEQQNVGHYVVGKRFVYEGEAFMGDFTLSIYADGTFQYYEGMLSSYIGMGAWTLNGGVLTIKDGSRGRLQPDGTWEYYNRVNRFRVEKDRLVWLAEGSDNFLYVDLADGAIFLAGEETLPEENPIFDHTKERFSLDEIRDLVVKQKCTEARLLELLEGYTCEETVELWGQPDFMTSGIWSNGWNLNEEIRLVVFYGGSDGQITRVRIRTIEE